MDSENKNNFTISREKLKELYEKMVICRYFEDKAYELFSQNMVRSFGLYRHLPFLDLRCPQYSRRCSVNPINLYYLFMMGLGFFTVRQRCREFH